MSTSSVMITDVSSPSVIHNIYGGRGTLLWKRLTTGSLVSSDIDSFEWVALAPGDYAGLHTHTNTEEIFFILSGRGRMDMDGQVYELGPGDLVVTPLGATHNMLSTGDEDLAYLVVEVYPPEIANALPHRGGTSHEAAH